MRSNDPYALDDRHAKRRLCRSKRVEFDAFVERRPGKLSMPSPTPSERETSRPTPPARRTSRQEAFSSRATTRAISSAASWRTSRNSLPVDVVAREASPSWQPARRRNQNRRTSMPFFPEQKRATLARLRCSSCNQRGARRDRAEVDAHNRARRTRRDRRSILPHPPCPRPDGKVGHDSFAVIRKTIRKMDKAAIGRVVLTDREQIIGYSRWTRGPSSSCSVPYEVRSEKKHFDEVHDVKVTKDIISVAKDIREPQRRQFDPEKFEGHYESALSRSHQPKEDRQDHPPKGRSGRSPRRRRRRPRRAEGVAAADRRSRNRRRRREEPSSRAGAEVDLDTFGPTRYKGRASRRVLRDSARPVNPKITKLSRPQQVSATFTCRSTLFP